MSTQEKNKTKPKKSATTAGAKLLPDLAKHTKGVVGKHWYWIGALPGCPREHLNIGSTDFPKMTENVRVNSRGKTLRRAQIGSIRELTLKQLERIEKALPNCIIRFDKSQADDARDRQEKGTPELGGAGSGLEVLDDTRRRGRPIRIPTDAQIAKAKADGRPLRPFTGDVNDEPAADYVFAELCSDQHRPQRSDYYPDPLSVTGLEWPTDSEE